MKFKTTFQRNEMYAGHDLLRLINHIGEGWHRNFHVFSNGTPIATEPHWLVFLANGTAFEIFPCEKHKDESWEDYNAVYVGLIWSRKLSRFQKLKRNLLFFFNKEDYPSPDCEFPLVQESLKFIQSNI